MDFLQRRYWCTLAILSGVAIAGCSREPQKPEVKIERTHAQPRSITDVRREDGRLQACRVFSFMPVVGDLKLIEINIKEGASVKVGQKLYAFETEPLIEQVKILQLRTNALVHKIESARFHKEVESPAESEMNLIEAQTSYEDAVRVADVRTKMNQGGLAVQSDLDKALRDKQSAELSFQLSKERYERAVAGRSTSEIADLEIELKRCNRELGELDKQLADCVGTAPFAGRILSINGAVKDYGDDLGENGISFNSGRGPLLILGDTSKMRIIASFFEAAVAFIKPGQQADVIADHAPGQVFSGSVATVSELGHAHGQSSTVSVEVMVNNEKGLLKPGLTAEVSIIVSQRENVLSIPSCFLRCSDEGYFVWLIDGEDLIRTAVEIGISDRDFVEILSGLKSGDEVVME